MAKVVKIRKKGILIIPKRLREEVSIQGGEVSIEVKEVGLLIKPLKTMVVDVDPNIVDELIEDGGALERANY